MSFIEMVTIQKGGVWKWQRTKTTKRKNKTNKINPRLATLS